jgi:hypothetical protein
MFLEIVDNLTGSLAKYIIQPNRKLVFSEQVSDLFASHYK